MNVESKLNDNDDFDSNKEHRNVSNLWRSLKKEFSVVAVVLVGLIHTHFWISLFTHGGEALQSHAQSTRYGFITPPI